MFTIKRYVLSINAHSIPEEDKTQFPNISTPQSLGGYSLSPLGAFENHMRGMRYIVIPPPQKFPLYMRDNENTKPFNMLPERQLDNLLHYMMPSARSSFLTVTNTQQIRVNADIVCTSEVLELMMCAPYEHSEGWTLAVSKYRNTMYIHRVVNSMPDDAFESHNLRRMLQESRQKMLRKYCLSSNGLVLPDGPEACGENDRFMGVFSFELNSRRIVFDSPVLAEAATDQFQAPGYNWAELQVRQDNMNRSEWKEHNRTEALKWWCKCFLLNIKNLFVGCQNDDAYVHFIKKTSVRDLWKDCENDWNTGVCANFMVRLLSCITQITAQLDCPSSVYLIEFDAKRGEVAYEVFEGWNDHTFLPDWFHMMLDRRIEDVF